MAAKNPRHSSLLQQALLAMLSGAIVFLISPPHSLAFLQWLCWVPLLAVLEGASLRRDFLLGWIGGFAFNVAGLYWIVYTIVVFSDLPLPLALLALVLFSAYGAIPYGLFFMLVPRLRKWRPRLAAMSIPAFWVSIEYLFPLIFPYHQGDLQYRNLALMQLASITGVSGLSFLVVAANLIGLECWEAARGIGRWPWRALAVFATVTALILIWGRARVRDIDRAIASGPKVTLGLIQGNYGAQERRKTRQHKVMARYRRLSEEAVAKGATLLIWGEGASPYRPRRHWDRVHDLVDELGVDLITGGYDRKTIDDKVHYYNAAYGVHRDSTEYDTYSKIVLLPFGEYMPLSDTFPQLKGKIKGIGDFTPGEPKSGLFRFDQPQGEVRALILICYEAILEEFVHEQAQGKANLLVNITHDAWFGDTSAPHQFLMVVAARAIEHGASVARVANTGVSCVIDPTGRIRSETPLFSQAALVEEASLEQFPTVFARVGNLFARLCVVAIGGLGVLYWLGRRTKARNA